MSSAAIITQLGSVVVAAIAAWAAIASQRAARRAADESRREDQAEERAAERADLKAEAEASAYQRAQAFYIDTIARQDRELEILRSRLDAAEAELATARRRIATLERDQ